MKRPFKINHKYSSVFLSLMVLILILDASNDGKTVIEFLVLVILVSFIGLFFYFVVDRFIQKRKVAELKEASLLAEMDSLKTQMNPHFFFNTLNNLYSLTVKKSEDAPATILKLSDIMRYTIYEGAKEAVALKDEIQYLENYIDLQKIRFKRNLELTFETSIEDENQEIPPLLFIVLLENAFKHGAESLTENPYIHVRCFSTSEHITFEIKNNCEAIKIPNSAGIGLKNLRRRLQLIYPERHTLDIDETVHGVYNIQLKVTFL